MSETHNEAKRKWARNNSEKRRESTRRWRALNRERSRELARRYQQSPKGKATRRAYYEKARERLRENARAFKYGMRSGEFDALLERQGGRCAICRGDKPRGLNWHVDHDHKSGAIRGILCKPCNTALGAFGDSVEGLMRALEYLRQAENSADDVMTRSAA